MAEAAPRFSNLQLRVMSAVVMIVVVLALAWLGGVWFRALAALIGFAMLVEWMTMAGWRDEKGHAVVCAAALAVVLVALVAGLSPWLVLGALAVAVGAALVSSRFFGQGNWHAWGIVYAGFSAIALAGLRGDTDAGLLALLFLFAVVWVTDIAAYFVGRRFGGPKLAPSISPGKTWSGALGGALFGTAAGTIVVATAGLFDTWLYSVLGFVLSVLSQAGDLFESWVKRRCGAKDSGNLIPGHGGVMDRVDGLVAAAFALYVIGGVISGLDSPAAGLFTP